MGPWLCADRPRCVNVHDITSLVESNDQFRNVVVAVASVDNRERLGAILRRPVSIPCGATVPLRPTLKNASSTQFSDDVSVNANTSASSHGSGPIGSPLECLPRAWGGPGTGLRCVCEEQARQMESFGPGLPPPALFRRVHRFRPGTLSKPTPVVMTWRP